MHICQNPNCSKEFEPGHYGSRQLICGRKKCLKWYKLYQIRNDDVPRGIPDEDFDNVLHKVDGDVLKSALFITARHTGMRKGELLGLIWSDLLDRSDKIKKHIRVVRQWNDRKKKFGPTKTKKGRTAYILLPARNSLLDLYYHNQPKKEDRVFSITGKTAYKWFIAAQECMGILNPLTESPYRFHDLRHALATELVTSGRIDLAQLALGHRDIQTTLRYAKKSPDQIIEEVENLRL